MHNVKRAKGHKDKVLQWHNCRGNNGKKVAQGKRGTISRGHKDKWAKGHNVKGEQGQRFTMAKGHKGKVPQGQRGTMTKR